MLGMGRGVGVWAGGRRRAGRRLRGRGRCGSASAGGL